MSLADIMAGVGRGFGALQQPTAMASGQPAFMPQQAPQQQQPHGFAGFIDRALNPSNALGQFGQALVAGGGSLADAMGYLMQSRAAREAANSKFGDWQQQYDYELAHPKASVAGPHYFEDNGGNQWAIGADGTPVEIHHDNVPKYQMVIDPKTGEVRPIPIPGTGNVPAETTQSPLGITFTPIGPQTGGPTPNASGPFPVSRLDQITAQGESGGRRYGANGNLLRSPVGAMGEMQVMPSTARDPGFGIRAWDGSSPDDLARVGRDYRAKMQARYGGDTAKMWAAYNWGPGNVDAAIQQHGPNWLDHAPAETRAYVTRNRRNLMGGN